MYLVQDLHACVQHLQSELDITKPEQTALVGRSAGALPVAMFCNLWPRKIQAALLQVTWLIVMVNFTCTMSCLHIM